MTSDKIQRGTGPRPTAGKPSSDVAEALRDLDFRSVEVPHTSDALELFFGELRN
ncbi:hypothetical protein [Streptomyces sp. NPDC055299]